MGFIYTSSGSVQIKEFVKNSIQESSTYYKGLMAKTLTNF